MSPTPFTISFHFSTLDSTGAPPASDRLAGRSIGLRFLVVVAERRAVMEDTTSWHRIIASYVPPASFGIRTRVALEGLGYRVVAAATRGQFNDDSWDPDLRIVDERHIERVPPEDFLPRTPMILLTGESPLRYCDRRVIGSVTRPATLESLYPLLQRALEDTPRGAARIPTQLPGRCT